MGKGRRKASRNCLEEYVSKRKGFLIKGKKVFILREDGNSSGKVEDRRDIFMDGTKAGTGKRCLVQRQVQNHFTSETGEQGVRLGAESTGAFGLRLRRESFHLRISMQ